jgi:hypothetical protein
MAIHPIREQPVSGPIYHSWPQYGHVNLPLPVVFQNQILRLLLGIVIIRIRGKLYSTRGGLVSRRVGAGQWPKYGTAADVEKTGDSRFGAGFEKILGAFDDSALEILPLAPARCNPTGCVEDYVDSLHRW